MKKSVLLWVGVAVVALLVVLLVLWRPGGRGEVAEIRVLTDRTESHLAPLFAAYQKASSVTVKAVYLDKGLLSRLESRPTEADVVITKDVELLEIAKNKGLIRPYSSPQINKDVPPQYRDPGGYYFSDSYRARAIYYSKERVKPEDLSTYEALAEPKWKGRICLRSGYHDYNLSLFGQLLSVWGEERTKKFLVGLADNLARTPIGDDRGQVRAIYEKTCDIALVNSYYWGIMHSSKEQRPWAQATEVFFPNQAEGGTLILRSGLALTQATTQERGARALLEFFVQAPAQQLLAELTFAFPVRSSTPIPEITQKLGEGQPGVRGGSFRIRSISPADIARHREAVIRLLDEIRFDRPR